MSRATLLRRIRELETWADPNSRHSFGLIVLPAMLSEREWVFSVQISLAGETSEPCNICGLPATGECTHPDVPPPRVLKPLPRRKWGTVQIDSGIVWQDTLFDCQRNWCVRYGIGSYCGTCLYPMAEVQQRCLVCIARGLIADTSDEVIAQHRWYLDSCKEPQKKEVEDGNC